MNEDVNFNKYRLHDLAAAATCDPPG